MNNVNMLLLLLQVDVLLPLISEVSGEYIMPIKFSTIRKAQQPNVPENTCFENF